MLGTILKSKRSKLHQSILSKVFFIFHVNDISPCLSKPEKMIKYKKFKQKDFLSLLLFPLFLNHLKLKKKKQNKLFRILKVLKDKKNN
ncbi:hypothetical protein BpHYR1_028747 [Brachionus plicatilis]|uniref:Uncharacterized protein n=1 Tax=Brachionus plicatilis TaxID=10195 RepID=A0A3M7QL11_BRAPC|nr:hypothetical protein BpHYR1_028747 [Brachionus plicatilis]